MSRRVSAAAVALSRRLYSLLLRAYPPGFRRRYGAEMAWVFARDLERASGDGAPVLARLWLRVLGDWLLSMVPERITALVEAVQDRALPAGRHPAPPHHRPKEARDMFHDLLHDLRLSARSLGRSRGFTAVAILILALGVGLNSTIFTLAHGLFLVPPPGVAQPDRLVRVNRTSERFRAGSLSYPDYRFYQQHNDVFSGLAAYDSSLLTLAASWGEELIPARAGLVSGNYFDVLGVAAVRGRTFDPEEAETLGGPAVVVISHGFWQRALGGRADVVGSRIGLGDHPFTVLGVAPADFRGVGPAEAVADLWVPLVTRPLLQPGDEAFLTRIPGEVDVWLWAVGRLAPGVSLQAAAAEMDALSARLAQEYPEWSEGQGVALTPHFQLHPPLRESLLDLVQLLAAVVAAVLVIASANLAILMLARGSARRREMAVRAALGAGRGRMARALLAESLLLALAGGAAGFVLAWWGSELAAALLPVSLAMDLRPDLAVLAFTLALSGVTAVLFGIAPALQAARADVASGLKLDGAGGRRSLSRSSLVVAQVALSIVLVSGAGLLLRSLWRAQGEELGFEVRRGLLVSFDLARLGYDEISGRQRVGELLERVAAVPGVEAVSTTRMVPFRGAWTGSFGAEEVAPEAAAGSFDSGFNIVGPGYFQAMGIPLLAGRDFSRGDAPDQPLVVVMNRAAAAMVWPGQSPVGKRIFRDEEMKATVVGLVEDATYYELGEAPHPQIYLALGQIYSPRVNLLVRTAGAPESVAGAVQGAIRSLDPRLAFGDLRTLEEIFGQEIARYRVSALLVGLFALLALSLAAVGLYGVLSYLVAQRTREIGVRVALGASRRQVARAVVARGLTLALAGIAVGLAVAWSLAHLVAGFLYGVEPRDPVTLVAVPLLLAAVALAASLLPARRATRVDPLAALRAE